MKTVKILAACSVLMLGVSGCDLTGLNDNPNKPTDDVDYNMNEPRLASTIRGGRIIDGDIEQRLKPLQLDFYSQMAIDGGAWNMKNYMQNDGWNNLAWSKYLEQIASINIAIRSLSPRMETYANTIAFARIWRVYVHSQAVDLFGPMPFPSATDDPEVNPVYKSVKDIYYEYFTELEEANKMFNPDAGPIFTDNGIDIVYKGNTDAWKKFANALRLRFAVRLSEIDPSKCAAEAKAALADPAGMINAATDNAYLPPKADGSWGQDYNYTMFQITWAGPICMSKSYEKLVTNLGGIAWPNGVQNLTPTLSGKPAISVSSVHPAKVDPRGPKMFQPGIQNGDWKGLIFGAKVEDANVGIYESKNCAELGFLIKDGASYKSRPYDLFLYEEVCFLKAELYARNIVPGNAKAEYENGIRASFEKWGVGNQANDYLTSTDKNDAGTSAKYDDVQGAGNTVLEKIITQKYIAAVPDLALEGWNDKRRLNLPRMDVAVYRDQAVYNNSDTDIKKPQNFIKRMKYPTNENLINATEYNRGLEMLGNKDIVSSPLWWDMNKNYCTSDK